MRTTHKGSKTAFFYGWERPYYAAVYRRPTPGYGPTGPRFSTSVRVQRQQNKKHIRATSMSSPQSAQWRSKNKAHTSSQRTAGEHRNQIRLYNNTHKKLKLCSNKQ